MENELTVCCADVGSVVSGNFGWALRDYPDPLREVASDASIIQFLDAILERLSAGRAIALGFECPLFVPHREDPAALAKARRGEGNRPWSAGAGAGSMATGIVQAAWLLGMIRQRVAVEPRLTFSWTEFIRDPNGLLIWEALVTRKSKVSTHHGDAGEAVEAFCAALPDPSSVNAVSESSVLSLVGAAALRTGWDVPHSILREPCLVLEA
jgi:hypothetical protein